MLTNMETWAEVRRRVLAGEISKRQVCREYYLHWDTLKKILDHEEPPGYRQRESRAKPTLGPFLPVIHQILEADRQAPRGQRHTARRIFDRLRQEHGYTGCESIVRAAVADWKKTRAEVFVPLAHPPGEAQVDFGLAEVVVAGERVTAAFFVMTLPHSDAFFVRAYPKECTESFQDGHVRAFAYFGGVPTAMRNEVLAKFVAHNVCCVISAIYELGIDPAFVGLNVGPDDAPRSIIKFPGVG